MNIFVLDTDPVLAAQYQSDIHVRKMLLESTQLLSTAMWENGQTAPYKKTHVNHPCSIWVRTSHDNFCWLMRHAFALSCEYSYRREKLHKCHDVLNTILNNYNHSLPHIGITKFAQAMPEQYRNDCVMTAYRQYYLAEKREFIIRGKVYPATWTKRGKPYWWKD